MYEKLQVTGNEKPGRKKWEKARLACSEDKIKFEAMLGCRESIDTGILLYAD